MRYPRLTAPYLIGGTYFLIGLIWILLTDELAFNLFGEDASQEGVQKLKGIFFITGSSLLIMLLVRYFNRLAAKQEAAVAALQSMPAIGFVTFRRSGRITSASSSIPAFLGYPPRTFRRLNLLEATHADDREQEREMLARLVRGELQHAHYVKRTLAADGEYRWLELFVTCMGPAAWCREFAAAVQNVHERIMTARALEERQGQLKQAQRIARIGDWTFDGETGKMSWGIEVYRIFGRNPEDGPPEYEEVLRNHFSPDETPEFRRVVARALKSGTPYDVTHDLLIPDGSRKRVRSVGEPYWSREAGCWMIRGIIQDLTDLHLAQRQLQQHEGYWDLVRRHSTDAILACDSSGKILFFNDTLRAWVGPEEQELPPHQWPRTYGLYKADGTRLLRAEEMALTRALRGEEVRNARFQVRQEGRDLRHLEANCSPVYTDAGELLGAIAVIRDITIRLQQENEVAIAVLEAAEKERSAIAAELHDGIVQELGMASLNLNNSLSRQENAEQGRQLVIARRHLTQAIEMTRNLSHRIIPPFVQGVSLQDAVEELVEEIQDNTRLDITLVCNGDLKLKEALQVDVFRILQECLNNVVRHAAASLVTINIDQEPGQLCLTVMDDGEGIPPDNESDQAGIGLKTIHFRSQRWNGFVIIESEPGSTTVRVEIPLEDES